MKKSMKTEIKSEYTSAGFQPGKNRIQQHNGCSSHIFTLIDAKYTLSTEELRKGDQGRYLLVAPGDTPGTARTLRTPAWTTMM